MDAILNLQAVPLGTVLTVGGPVVALGGISLWLFKEYVNDQKRKSSNFLPPVPGKFIAFESCMSFISVILFELNLMSNDPLNNQRQSQDLNVMCSKF